jgi:hypothetical protein
LQQMQHGAHLFPKPHTQPCKAMLEPMVSPPPLLLTTATNAFALPYYHPANQMCSTSTASTTQLG